MLFNDIIDDLSQKEGAKKGLLSPAIKGPENGAQKQISIHILGPLIVPQSGHNIGPYNKY